MAYSEKVIDHYKDPRNVGSFNKEEDGSGNRAWLEHLNAEML